MSGVFVATAIGASLLVAPSVARSERDLRSEERSTSSLSTYADRTLRANLLPSTGPRNERIDELSALTSDSFTGQETLHQIAVVITQARIFEKVNEARDEGLEASTPSLEDARNFLFQTHFVHPPSAFVLDNGNVRLVWRSAEKEQVALQFRGQGEVQFVIFAKRSGTDIWARSAGRDAVNAIARQVSANGLHYLLG